MKPAALAVAAVAVAAVAAVLAAAAPARAAAPLAVTAAERPRAASVAFGFAAGAVAEVAYAQRLAPLAGRALALEARLTLPVVSLDLADSAWQVGLEVEAWRAGALALRPRVDLGLRLVDNGVFAAAAVQVGAGAAFGLHGRLGHLALEAGWTQGLSTYIAHDDWYRETVYAGAEDGWLAWPGGFARVALAGGLRLGDRTTLGVRLGVDLDARGEGATFFPIVATLSLAAGF